MVHLFGVLYADEIEACGDAPTAVAKEIVKTAGIPESYYSEIDKGRLLAEHVTVRDRSVWRWWRG